MRNKGCDGGRLYFDGCASICVNGDVVGQASQFSLNDVEVITAVIDLDDIRRHRHGTGSLQVQSSQSKQIPIIDLRHFSLRIPQDQIFSTVVTRSMPARIPLPAEECALGPACWLWYIYMSKLSMLLSVTYLSS